MPASRLPAHKVVAAAVYLVLTCPVFAYVPNVLDSESPSVFSDIPGIGEPSEGLSGSSQVLSMGTDVSYGKGLRIWGVKKHVFAK